MTRVIAVSGYKNSGKTTLCKKLIAGLVEAGVSVGYVKRTSDELYEEGVVKPDSLAVTNMGIDSVLWAKDGLRFDMIVPDEGVMESVIAKCMPDKELIILEGGKKLNIPKIWVCSAAEERIDFPGVFLYYDRFEEGGKKKVFSEGDEKEIVDKLVELVRGENYRSTNVYIGNEELPVKNFIAEFIKGAVVGMLSSLKGAHVTDTDEPIRICITGKK
ncbi:MAG: molybdopterin-guanine dinucleotide biosynthesis protein MobB [Synergistaceae bacterium]